MSARRRKGEGSISRHHNHPTCPAPMTLVDPATGKPVTMRPAHECKGPFTARAWVRTASGEKVRKRVYGKTEKAVLKELKKLAAEEVAGHVVAKSPTVKMWLRTDAAALGITNWWTDAEPKLKVNTRKGYNTVINQRIIPTLGHHRLDRLTQQHVADFYDALRAQGLSESSVRGTHAVLRRALTVAVRKGKVARNVCELVEPPKQGTSKPREVLTVQQAWKVLHAAGDNPRYWLALLGGLRQGEALALRWSAVYLDAVDEDGNAAPHLVVREALSREPGVGLVFDKPKSAESTNRVVPLLPQVADRLRAMRVQAFAKGATEDDLLWTSPTGLPRDHRVDWAEWRALLALAGVPLVTLHSARNTCAQLLEAAGVPERVVADILGHAQVAMTHHYQKGNTAAKADAMQRLAEYVAAKEPRPLRAV